VQKCREFSDPGRLGHSFWIRTNHRALESARPDAPVSRPVRGPTSRVERGRRISDAMPTSAVVAWTVALRTRIIDDYIMSAFARGSIRCCASAPASMHGPYRMALPPELRWIEADYPHVMDYTEGSSAMTRLPAGWSVCESSRRCGGAAEAVAPVDASSKDSLADRGVIPYLANDEAASLAAPCAPWRRARPLDRGFICPRRPWRSGRRRGVRRSDAECSLQFAPAMVCVLRSARLACQRDPLLSGGSARYARPMPLPVVARVLITVSHVG